MLDPHFTNPDIQTSVESIHWPAIPSASSAARLAGLFQLEMSQWWSEAQLKQHQYTELDTVIKHAVRHIPFYQSYYADLQDTIRSQNISTYWDQIPILTRKALQQAGDTIRNPVLPKSHGKAMITQTSGSTGEPVKVWLSGVTQYFWNVFTLRDHCWHKRDFSQTLASIRAFRHLTKTQPDVQGHHATNWGSATAGVYQTGPTVMLDVGIDISQQIAWLQQHQPAYLLTYPSNLKALIEYSDSHRINMPKLKQVRTISEIVTPALRDLCQEHWQAPIVDTYSSQEFGYIALQCPEHAHYHIQSENVLVEILDKDNQPVRPGQIGRLVISALHNYACPLIRYEIGDYAQAGETCACGRGLPVITQILGRTRNMLVMPDGELRWPIFGFRHFREIAPIQQFQCLQTSNTKLHFRVVAERTITFAEEQSLRALIQKYMGYPFEITFEYLNLIPRSAGGKYEEFISDIH